MDNGQWTNPNASTNMTMIAEVQGDNVQGTKVNVYVGDELVGRAEPITNPSLSNEVASPLSEASPLYFLTIQSDRSGELRFELEDGTTLKSEMPLRYEADAHHGSLESPVLLRKDDHRPYKLIENDHVVIIRDNVKYDVTGKKL